MTVINPELIRAEGEITGLEGNGTFIARMANGHMLTAFTTGKKSEKAIQLLQGEKVLLEISPYDLSRGRIVTVSSVADSAVNVSTARKSESQERAVSMEEGEAEAFNDRLSELTVASGGAIP